MVLQDKKIVLENFAGESSSSGSGRMVPGPENPVCISSFFLRGLPNLKAAEERESTTKCSKLVGTGMLVNESPLSKCAKSVKWYCALYKMV